MKKVIKFFKVLFWSVWIFIFIIGHIGIIAAAEYHHVENVKTGIIIILAWWILTLTVSITVSKLKSSLDKAKKEKYNNRYVSEIIIQDEKLGQLKLEKDTNKNIISGTLSNISFGKYIPDVEISCNEGSVNQVISDFKELLDNSESILRDFYTCAAEMCNNWDEQDSYGNPISEEYAKEYLSVDIIEVQEYKGETEVSLWGMIIDDYDGEPLLGGHSIIAEINCATKETVYNLIG